MKCSYSNTQSNQSNYSINRINRIMEHYNCSEEDAIRFIELREDGHASFNAAVMAGISDANY